MKQALTDYSQCDRVPDITVNATSAPVPVMDIAAAHPGNLHICVGGLDLAIALRLCKKAMNDGVGTLPDF